MLTVRPAATIGTGHTPPDRGARTTAAVRPRNHANPGQTRRPGQSGQFWPAAISPCAMAGTRTPRGVSATRCWCRGWTSPYRTAGTRLSASTGPARRHRVQDEYEFIQACQLSVSAGQQRGRGHAYERTSEYRQRRRSTPPVPLTSSRTRPRRSRRRLISRSRLAAMLPVPGAGGGPGSPSPTGPAQPGSDPR
jgi:hypothetical protein